MNQNIPRMLRAKYTTGDTTCLNPRLHGTSKIIRRR